MAPFVVAGTIGALCIIGGAWALATEGPRWADEENGLFPLALTGGALLLGFFLLVQGMRMARR